MAAIGGASELGKLVVYASDFTRARETAEEAVAAIWEEQQAAAETAGPM